MRTRLLRCYVMLLAAVLCIGCTDGDEQDAITLTSGSAIELYPVAKQRKTLEFYATASWTAACQADWVQVSPKSGEAGSQQIVLTTTSTNRTKAARTAQLTLTAGGSHKNVTVIQSGKYAVFDRKEYTIGAEGGTLTMGFTSNLEKTDALKVGYNALSWIGWADEARVTRADWTGELPELVVQPNTSETGRMTAFALVLLADDDTQLPLDTAVVYQSGAMDDYESTDFSADGTVSRLQQATKGKGIPIVLMGDGFADRDIADGTYDRVMSKAAENLFSEEPVSSLRDYFDVYAVTAVSRHGHVGSSYETAFSTVPDKLSSDISCDDSAVSDYVELVSGINPYDALAVVILNSHLHNGITYMYSDGRGHPVQYAISLCPVIDSLQSETFRQVLVHEAIGHGLAKLADEYGYVSNGEMTDEAREELATCHGYGWMQNVDDTSDPSAVCWSLFIGDGRFTDEAIGVYEGGYTYATGAYRPTEESMMNSNASPFNAPSRRLIYNKVMELGEGRTDASLDEFAAFDADHKPQQWSYVSASRAQWRSNPAYFAPPVIKRR